MHIYEKRVCVNALPRQRVPFVSMIFLLSSGAADPSGAAFGQGIGPITPPAPLNTNAATDTGTDTEPQLTTDGVGNWLAVWRSSDTLGGTVGTDFDVFFARSGDGGITWSAPQTINANATSDNVDDLEPTVATDGNGTCVAVWTEPFVGGSDLEILRSRSTDNGATWDNVLQPVHVNSSSDRFAQIATDGTGNWVIVWQSNEPLPRPLGMTAGPDDDIFFKRSLDNGVTWDAAPSLLNTNAIDDSGADTGPAVATDGGGTWIAVWESADTLGDTIGADVDLLFSRSTFGVFSGRSAPLPLNTNAATDSGGDLSPQLATDGAGTWVVVWSSTDTLDGSLGSDTDILVARSVDGGATWSPPAALNTNAATDTGSDTEPRIATDDTGNWVAVWRSTDSLGGTIGTDDDLLIAGSADGGVTWSAPQPLNTNAATDSQIDALPSLVTDGTDWVVAWVSFNSLGNTIGGDADILTARFTVSSEPSTIPALSVWGLVALAALLVGAATAIVRRRGGSGVKA